MVYSPLDAVKIARENPDMKVVFFGVGFETTAPPTPWRSTRRRSWAWRTSRSSALTCSSPRHERNSLLPRKQGAGISRGGARLHGHGYEEYFPLAERYHVPIVVTGFEPLDLLQGST